MSFDPSTFDQLLTLLGRTSDDAVRIGWASHEADFMSKLVIRPVVPEFVSALMDRRVNVYFEINPSSHEGKGRSSAHEVTQLTALWADVDFKGGGMRSEDGARQLIDQLSRALGAEPAAIVYSGGGCQPYWPLDGVTAERYGVEKISALSKRWGALVRRFAIELGGGADGVFDLARVFRIPGTINVKYEGAPRPVTVDFAERALSFTLEEIEEMLDEWGVVKPDTGLSDTILSPESDWKWSDEDCHFVGTVRAQIASSEPVARHQWMLKWSALLFGMIRNGCVTETTFYELRDLLAERFTYLCQHAGTPRMPSPREFADAFAYGQQRAQLWDDAKLATELRQHVHRDFDEQFALMTEQPVVAPVQPSVQLPPMPPMLADRGSVESGDATAVPAVAAVPAPVGVSVGPKKLDRMQVAPRTDTGNADRLARKFVGEFIYVPGMEWMRFDGSRYVRDEAKKHIERAKDVFMALYTTGSDADQKWALKSLNAAQLRAAISLAQSTPEMVRPADTMDAQEYELCTPAGIVDLRTGQTRPADPKVDMHTKQTMVAPDWSVRPVRFLQLLEWMQPEPEVRAYLQRLAGIALIGNVDFQVFPIFVGPGSNGKTTLLELEGGVMGDYATVMPKKFLVEKMKTDHPTEVAQLLGVRLAINSEVPAKSKFDEDFVKQLTGERKLRGRFMGKDYFSFTNTALQAMAANHLPGVVAGGRGLWRRIRKIDFRARIDGAENQRLVPDLLRDEGAGILAWMIDGARDVIAHGEQVPKSVEVATEQYRYEEDALARFIRSTIEPAVGNVITRDTVYATYRQWCFREGLSIMAAPMFEREILNAMPEANSLNELVFQNIGMVGVRWDAVTGAQVDWP